MNLGLKPRKNLQILLAVLILSIGDLGTACWTLLLRLADLDPLLCCQMLAQFRKHVGCQTESLKKRTVVNRVENDIVVGSMIYQYHVKL